MHSNYYIRLEDMVYMTASEIIAANPSIGFAVPFEPPPGHVPTIEQLAPPCDERTHIAVLAPPELVDEEWHMRWAVLLLTPGQLEERAQALADARDVARGRIEAWRDEQERSGIVFEHAGRAWDGGPAVRQRMQPMLALPGLPDGFFWTDADNNDVPVTLADLGALCAAHELAIIGKGFDIHKRQRLLKASVDAMESADELQAFVPGWAV